MNNINVFLIVFAGLLFTQFCLYFIHKNRAKFANKYSKYIKTTEIGIDSTFILRRFISNFGRRLSVTWVLFFSLLISFSIGYVGIVFLFMLISFLALREFVSIMELKSDDYWQILIAFYVFLPLQYFFVLTDFQFLFFIFLPVYGFLIFPLISAITVTNKEDFFERAAKFQWSQIACVYCLSYIPAIMELSLKDKEYGGLLLYLIVLISLSDGIQYIVNNLFGKKKIAPILAPRKTLEGLVCGIVITSLLSLLLIQLTPFNNWQSLIMSFVICIAGFLGSLVMNGIKSSIGIKYWSDVLGANGGILDRFDSLIFAAPLFYHLCKYFFN